MSHATLSIIIELLDEIYDLIRYRNADPSLEVELLAKYFADKHLPFVSAAFLASFNRVMTLKESVDLLSSLLVKGETSDVNSLMRASSYLEYSSVDVPKYVEFEEELKKAGVQLIPFHLTSTKKELLPYDFFLSHKSKNRIIKNIFHGHKNKYQSLIDTINASTHKRDALINLDTTLELQRANRDSKPARKLFEALEQRYSK
jgi:hypothetical protein